MWCQTANMILHVPFIKWNIWCLVIQLELEHFKEIPSTVNFFLTKINKIYCVTAWLNILYKVESSFVCGGRFSLCLTFFQKWTGMWGGGFRGSRIMFGRGESSLSTPHPRCQRAGLAPPTDLQERDPRDTLGVSPK